MFAESITENQAALIRNSPLFFVASADPRFANGPNGEGPVNVSPKGGLPLHILSPNQVAYLDYPGSGNETARHASGGGPITVVVCSFEEKDAAIVRLYGKATAESVDTSPIAAKLLEGTPEGLASKLRQVISIDVEATQTSCGHGVPVMEFLRDRRREDRGRRYW